MQQKFEFLEILEITYTTLKEEYQIQKKKFFLTIIVCPLCQIYVIMCLTHIRKRWRMENKCFLVKLSLIRNTHGLECSRLDIGILFPKIMITLFGH